jgi:DNA (cytosine-5)-methyltransferase 3A
MKVLSLFDGMSCGQIALERAGIKVDQYFAAEVDDYAMKVTQHNYPETIQIGDVTKVSYENGVLRTANGDFKVGSIDLIIGGSPCQSFSNLGDGSGFDGKSGLFFHWLRIKNEVNPKWFLLENVTMKKQWSDKITELLKVDHVAINSNLVSAQNRSRLYWTNIPVDKPTDKCITLSNIIDKEVHNKYFLSDKAKQYIISKDRLKKQLTNINGNNEKSTALLARYTGLNGTFLCVDCNGKLDAVKAGTLTARYGKGVSSFGGDTFVYDASDLDQYRIRRFTPIECERLQTVPEGYTSLVSDSQRYKMLGNGWTVDVIAHIFNGLNKESK